MSYSDYIIGRHIEAQGYSFYGIIQAAMRKADTYNLEKLKRAFPGTWEELQKRYRTSGGLLEGEKLEE